MDHDTLVREAHQQLDAAIRNYQTLVEQDDTTYVEAWVLITHKRTAAWEQEETSGVGLAEAKGQSFVATRGLLDIALTASRANMSR